MTAGEFLSGASHKLKEAGISTARLDCLILLEDVLKLDRTTIMAHPELKIAASKLAILNKKIAQRVKHMPLAYIRGKAEFFGREFMINKNVLVPRPETETIIEILLTLPLPIRPKIIDVGTGSGCIGITAALEVPGAEAILLDIDQQTLKVAAQNAKSLKAKVVLTKGNLLENQAEADIVLANLPYVPERYIINEAARHEPRQAIFGGKDGLNLYRRLWLQISGLTQKPTWVLTEALPPQHDDLDNLAKEAGYKLYQTEDFIQVFKLVD